MNFLGSSFVLPVERRLANLAELEAFGRELGEALAARGPLILTLTGDLGAGKTTLVGALVQFLGAGTAASPTYALHHRYDLAEGRHLDHWDLYRVNDESELDGAGFWEMLEFEQDLWAVEWPERVPDVYWPKGREIWNLELSKIDGGEARHVLITQKLR